MFACLTRLTCAVLLAITFIATSAAAAFSIEQPAQPLAARAPLPHAAGAASSHINAAGRPSADLSARVFDMQRLSDISLHPDFMPLAAGTPQTITVQVVPPTLIANSGATAVVTATVVDQDGIFLNGVHLSGFVTPTTLGGLRGLSVTKANGQDTGTWTAGTAVGSGTIEIGDGVVSGTATINLTAGAPFTVTLEANPTSLPVGSTSALTATVVDQSNNPVTDGTIVTFTSNIGTALSPRTTANGIATSSITSTVPGTARITAASGVATDTAAVVFAPGAPFTVTLEANPTSLPVGSASALTATVVDQSNNPVADGTTVTFASDIGTALSPSLTTNGVATSSITSTVAGTAHITAASGTASKQAAVVFTPGAPSTVTLQANPASLLVGNISTLTATVVDQYNNPVANGTTVTFASDVGSTLSPRTTTNGIATSSITSTVAGTAHITATSGSRSDFESVLFNPGAPFKLAIEDAPAGSGKAVNTATLDIYHTLTVYAAAYDVYNNLIGARSVTWVGTGVVSGRVSPTSGSSTTFTPASSGGTGTITASSGGLSDATGTITVQAPVLRISKTAPNSLTPGDFLQYTIWYTNTGNAAAQNVIITETYPGSATYGLASPLPTSGNNVWSIGTLAANGSGFIVVSMNTANQMPVGTVLTNSVRVSALKVAGDVYTTTTSVSARPDLSASVTDSPDSVRPGAYLAYLIQYRNDGSAPVTNVRVTETYPAQVSFYSASPVPDSGTNNVWSTSTPLNGNGDSRTILVTVRVNSPLADATILNDRVVVAAREAPLYTATQQTLVTAPNLQLSKSAQPSTPRANSLLTYTLSYTNSGSGYAANTIMTDALPANTSFGQCQPADVCNVNGSIVTWDVGQLDGRTSGTATLTVRIANNLRDGTVITNTARIASTDKVSAMARLTSTVSSAPDVTLSNSDGITQIAADQITIYTLNFANAGTAPAANVVITDRIPDYTTFVGCSSCVATGSRVYSFNLSTLTANQSGAATISVRLAPTLPAGLRAITNTAAIATTTGGDVPGNNRAQDVDDVSTGPVLALVPAYDSSTPYPGKVITYTLRYTNTSAMDTIGVVITATRPAWLTRTPPGWIRNGTSDVRSIGDLAARQSGSVTYVVTLPLTYTLDMRAFTVTFTIRDGGPGGLPPAQAQSTPLIGVPDLSIAQVIVPRVVPGQKFTATLIISNGGLGRACNPSICGPFYVDAFVDPATPPPSYPYVADGYPYAKVPPVGAGMTATVFITNIVFGANQDFVLYFKVDNYNCGAFCLPVGSKGGLVPEYNEYNNRAGPIYVPRFAVFLPLVLKNHP